MTYATGLYGKGLAGLWKQGWCEIPEVMATTLLALGAFPLALHGLYRIKRDGIERKRYRYDYIVFRHDDPRVKKLGLDSNS